MKDSTEMVCVRSKRCPEKEQFVTVFDSLCRVQQAVLAIYGVRLNDVTEPCFARRNTALAHSSASSALVLPQEIDHRGFAFDPPLDTGPTDPDTVQRITESNSAITMSLNQGTLDP